MEYLLMKNGNGNTFIGTGTTYTIRINNVMGILYRAIPKNGIS
jgi:hypothetical protein